MAAEPQRLLDVQVLDVSIQTVVTHSPSALETWISGTEFIHRHRLRRLIVGLDIEWRPNTSPYHNNPAATLQLCVGRRCVIFQLLHAPHIPQSLIEFLTNPDYTFVGVAIDNDVAKLEADYGIGVGRTVDLRGLAAEELGMMELRSAGIKTLAREVLGDEIWKPSRVTRSRWDLGWLSEDQIQYACQDAYISFEIGRRLNAFE